jgi:hypothetical protein
MRRLRRRFMVCAAFGVAVAFGEDIFVKMKSECGDPVEVTV